MEKRFIYFDYASTAPLSKDVLDKINLANKYYWGNVSSTYKFGIECAEELERIRANVSKIFNGDPKDIIFTSGSTESISIVFNKISESFTPNSVIISPLEHQASTIASNILKNKGWKIIKLKVNNEGIIDIKDFLNKIDNDTKLVSCIWGQSEIGTLQPVQEIGRICSRENILFHIDATQIISNGIFNWNNLNCDLLSMSGHKFGGPKGIGILMTNKKSRELLTNNDISLSHEYSIRPGTQALPLIIGMYQALKNIKSTIDIYKNEIKFKDNKIIYLITYLLKKFEDNKNILITGSIDKRLPNHLSFILFNYKSEPIKAYKIINFMSDNDIAISSGSACSSSTNKKSVVLQELGINEKYLESNIRISLSENNNKSELDRFYYLILECIEIF